VAGKRAPRLNAAPQILGREWLQRSQAHSEDER